MNGTEQAAWVGHERVIALLADRLCEAGVLRWPGMDGMTVDEVVRAAYRSGVNAESLPSPAELAERHPALTDDIRRYFADVMALASDLGGSDTTGRHDAPPGISDRTTRGT